MYMAKYLKKWSIVIKEHERSMCQDDKVVDDDLPVIDSVEACIIVELYRVVVMVAKNQIDSAI